MRPLKLRIKGLRSYVAEREIPFEDVDLMAIVGDTGAGKSSILEAICFALYGSATWNAKAAKPLISHGADTMEVELGFAAAGQAWTVYRSTSKGSYPPARSSLACEALGIKLDKKDEIDRKIVELVGLDYKAFLHCVILPQGRFQELLQATAADRTRLLKGVFQLDVLDRVRDWADGVLRERQPQLATLRTERARLRPDPAAEAEAARQALEAARRQHEALRAAQAQHREHAAAAAEAAAQVAQIDKLVASLDAAAIAATCAAIDEVRAVAGRIAAEQAALAAHRQEREAQRAEIAAALAGRSRDLIDGPGLARAGKALDRVSEIIARIGEDRAEIARREAEAGEARVARDRARDQQQGAASKREQAQRASMAAHLAAGLAHGDACPVCAQPVPAGFAPAAAPDLRKADKAVATAEKALTRAETALRDAEAALYEARRQADEDTNKLLDTLDDLPAALRPATEADQAPAAAAIEDARARLQALRAEIAALEQQRDALDRELDALRRQATALDARHTEEVRLRARDLRGEVAAYARAQADLATLLGNAPVALPPRDAEIEALEPVARALAAEVDTLLAAAAGRAAAAHQSHARAQARAQEILTAAGCATPDALAQRLGRLDGEIEQNERRHRDALSEIEPAAALDRRIATAGGFLDVVAEIRAHMADGKFMAYAVARKQEALLTVASRLLGGMTAGRFGFGEDFTVVDRRAGEARSTETLSGGETFLASLALALALVELAGRAGGRLDALFLDEGFGSLDPDALDLAVEALIGQARQGRLVAVISHLRAVAESIEDVLHVQATPEGSTARWLDAAERSALALDDAGLLG
jgi:exonuclease SbcC